MIRLIYTGTYLKQNNSRHEKADGTDISVSVPEERIIQKTRRAYNEHLRK